jgi:hypothetical protein
VDSIVIFMRCTSDSDFPKMQSWKSSPLDSLSPTGWTIALLFLLLFLSLTLAMWVMNDKKEEKRNSWKMFCGGLTVLFLASLFSKVLAQQGNVSILVIGMSMLLHDFVWQEESSVPCAIQTERYIATSLVMLIINFDVFGILAFRAMFVSWIDTLILFITLSYVGDRMVRKLRGQYWSCYRHCGSVRR